MKHIYLISLGGLILLMGMFLIVVTIQANNKYKFKKPAGEMLQYASRQQHFMDPENLKEMMASSKEIILIDIRTPREYMGNHIENAINIPFERLLDENHEALFLNGIPKVLYGFNSVRANSAWMLLTQYGYENLTVLNGGISLWQDSTQRAEKKGSGTILDEQPAFDYAGIMEKTEN